MKCSINFQSLEELKKKTKGVLKMKQTSGTEKKSQNKKTRQKVQTNN